jgi:hypothetical protein
MIVQNQQTDKTEVVDLVAQLQQFAEQAARQGTVPS